jgi:hypothetical protein
LKLEVYIPSLTVSCLCLFRYIPRKYCANYCLSSQYHGYIIATNPDGDRMPDSLLSVYTCIMDQPLLGQRAVSNTPSSLMTRCGIDINVVPVDNCFSRIDGESLPTSWSILAHSSSFPSFSGNPPSLSSLHLDIIRFSSITRTRRSSRPVNQMSQAICE